jgi:hypothetical protein
VRNHTLLIGSCIFSVWMLSLLPLEAQEYLTFDPPVSDLQTFDFTPVDYDKLSKAVACQETSCGKDGTARKRLNLHGIMCFQKDGTRYPCTFKSAADSHAEFKRIWKKPTGYYRGRFPDLRLATTWVCGPRVPTGQSCGHNGVDNPKDWLRNVTEVYNSL